MSKGEVNSAFGKRDWKKRQGLELYQLGVSLYLIPYSSINFCLHIIHKYIETHDQHMKNPLLHYFIKTAKSCIWRQGNAGRGLPGKYQFSRLFWRFLIHTNYDVILMKWFLFFQETSVSFTVQSGRCLLNEQLLSTGFVSLFSMCGPICYLLDTNNPDPYWGLLISSQTFLLWFYYHVGTHRISLLSTLWYPGWCHSHQRWRFDM